MHVKNSEKFKRAEEFDYADLITIESLFQAWSEFRKGKKQRNDVQVFERHLEDNLFELHLALKNKTYQHGNYSEFYVHDPKKRHIHKAPVADRVIHHLLYTYLYKLFDKTFIYDSYSCRLEKGTHKGILRLEKFTRIVSKNYTKECWVLKLDIKKFFANVDHEILLRLLERKIKDEDTLWLLSEVINSFCTCHPERGEGSLNLFQIPLTFVRDSSAAPQNDISHQGIPLGNLTSQVFANIYMNELDQFIKQTLRIKYYIRYADDFVFLAGDNVMLQQYVVPIGLFLKDNLKLELHPKKIIFRRLDWGVDFLGYIVLPYYILPRTKTKKRVFDKLKQKIGDENFEQSLQSYLGYLSHANSYKLTQQLKNQIWFWKDEGVAIVRKGNLRKSAS